MSEQWITASDLLKLALPGLPSSKPNLLAKAAREEWPSRPRKGRGGGKEYAVSALPEQAKKALAKRALEVAPVQAPVQLDLALTDAGSLREWQRSRMEARAAILAHVQGIATQIGIIQAENLFAEQSKSGALSPALQSMVDVANGRKGTRTGLSAVTLRRWRTEMTRADDARVLAPKAVATADPKPWLYPLLKLYGRPTQPSIPWCLEELAAQGFTDLPAVRTAQRVLADLGAITRNMGRMGPRALKRMRAYVKRSFDDLDPLDVISADGHTFKAEVRHPQHGGPFRPEIVTVIDIATRRVIGFSVGLAESAWTVADALRVAAGQGIAAILYTDNGCGFVNEHLDSVSLGLLGRIGTSHETAIAYNAQARGVIERLQATLWKREAKTLPAYLGHDMDREARQSVYRASRQQIRAAGQSSLHMSWPEFMAFAQAAIDRYNNRPHSSLPRIRTEGGARHQTPNEAWQAALDAGWSPILASPAELDDLFRPHVTRKVQRGTVSLFGGTYFHRDLDLGDWHGTEVTVGYDIHDPSRVWVRDPAGRLICVAELDAHAQAYMPRSRVEAARDKREAGRLARLETHREEILAERRPALTLAADHGELIDGEAVALAARLAELDAMDAAQTAPAPVHQPQDRPLFSSDAELAAWALANPARATDQDKALLRDALRDRDFLEVLDFQGVDAEALARLVTFSATRLSA